MNVRDDLVAIMKDMVIDTFEAIKDQVNPNGRKYNFEFFGYDFMIDEDSKVWLIEVNVNPFLGMPNQYTKVLVPTMMDEMLQIVVDPFYPPNAEYEEKARAQE